MIAILVEEPQGWGEPGLPERSDQERSDQERSDQDRFGGDRGGAVRHIGELMSQLLATYQLAPADRSPPSGRLPLSEAASNPVAPTVPQERSASIECLATV